VPVTTQTIYDDGGQVVQTIDAENNSTFTEYNEIGKPSVTTDKLGNQDNLHGLFEDIAVKNSARMLGSSASVEADQGNGWRTSFVNKGEESNVMFSYDQLPSNFNPSKLGAIPVDGGSAYFPGYTEIHVLDHKFSFVPFKAGERPHLISGNAFNIDAADNEDAAKPPISVPNAFSSAGATEKGDTFNQAAVAFAVANPQKTFELRKPHAFVRI